MIRIVKQAKEVIRKKVYLYIYTIKHSAFAKNVLTLSAGTLVSQIIALVTKPIIGRIYEQSELGDFAIIGSNSTIIITIAALGLMPAIMIPKCDYDAKNICRLLLKALLILPLIIIGIAVLLADSIRMFEVAIDYRFACVLMYAYIVTSIFWSVCYAYINRAKLYKVLFWNPTIMSVANATVMITLGALGCGLWGYTLANIIGYTVCSLHLLRFGNPFKLEKNKRVSSVRVLREYKDYAKYLLASNVVSTVGGQIPVQMINRFWGSVVTGSYTMCMSILGLPSKFLAQPINRVFYREAMERYNDGKEIGDFSMKLMMTNIKVALIPVSIIIIFGPSLFSLFLGTKWRQAGEIASIIGVYQLFEFSKNCLNGKYVIIGKPKIILWLNTIYILLISIVFVICNIVNASFYTTLLLYSISGSAFSIADNYIFLKKMRVQTCAYLRYVVLYLLTPAIIAFLLNRLLYMVLA